MEVIESSVQGICGRFRGTRKSNGSWVTLNFVAPNLVIYKISIEKRDWLGGLLFYSLPLGQGRCRVLARNYRNFFKWVYKLQPRWVDHWNRNQLLEEDLLLIAGQKLQIEQLGQSLKDLYLPLKTSDILVIEYRKWLDKFGSSLPYYQGYTTAKNIENEEYDLQSVKSDRFSQHTLICSSCNRAYQVTNQLQKTFVGVAIALFALAILIDNNSGQVLAVSGSILFVICAAIADKIKMKFERSYTRH